MPRFATLLFSTLCVATFARANPPMDPASLAKRIDERITEQHRDKKITPAPQADDAEFLRRVSLDLIGRIPTVQEVRSFLADPSPEKRSRLIDSLLDDPRHAHHRATVWRTLLIPETGTGGGRVFEAGFELWLRTRIRERVGYDKIVRELLAVPIAAEGTDAEVVFRNFNDANPLAFFAVKDARPENLAAATSKLFLGIQLECAQCHDHPFATWSQEQFWSQAAFFAGLKRQGRGVFAPLTETVSLREIAPTNSRKKPLPATFLDGSKPTFRDNVSARVALAEWITAPNNPYFPKATVNRVWGSMFGIGLVDPVDNFADDNPPSHPELLDDLAAAFVASGYDIHFLIRAIARTEAYQRSSAQTHDSQDNQRLFARMAVKGMTGEQFFDSLAQATGYQPGKSGQGRAASARGTFLTQFATPERLTEPETSVLQALTLMNGPFVADATGSTRGRMLTAIAETPGLSLTERIESLYLATLSRLPRDHELARMTRFVEQESRDRHGARLGDVLWVLLNSAEFRTNH